jgi:hypothetical protein
MLGRQARPVTLESWVDCHYASVFRFQPRLCRLERSDEMGNWGHGWHGNWSHGGITDAPSRLGLGRRLGGRHMQALALGYGLLPICAR